jgi:hypothetical protein
VPQRSKPDTVFNSRAGDRLFPLASAEGIFLTEAVQLHERIGTTEPMVGRTALWGAEIQIEQLGVNDPLAHLKQYAENGEAAIPLIDEDLITDLGERMVKPRFINEVNFHRIGDDFVSDKGGFSMKGMTRITADKFSDNVVDLEEYKRAKVEQTEPEKLSGWFQTAELDDAFIAESVRYSKKERYSVVRIYRKLDNDQLQMYVFPLHNATVETFNQLHQSIGAEVDDSNDPLELLGNMYAHRPGQNFDLFLKNYIAAHDGVMAESNTDEEYSFGLSLSERAKEQDDIEMVRSQTGLRQIYLEAIKEIATSGGEVTSGLLSMRNRLDVRPELTEGDSLDFEQVQTMLDDVIQYIAATINEAGSDDLKALSITHSLAEISDAARYFGMRARQAGIKYGGACPSKRDGILGETDALGMAFGEGDCDYISKECPMCHEKNVHTTVKKEGNGKTISGSCGCSVYVAEAPYAKAA